MDEMSTTVWLVLALVYAVVLMVLYHKIFIVYYFRLFNGLMKEFITCFFIGLVLACLTLYFWYVVVILILLVGLMLLQKIQSNNGKIAVAVIFVVIAIVVGLIGKSAKESIWQNKDEEDDVVQSTNVSDTYDDYDSSYDDDSAIDDYEETDHFETSLAGEIQEDFELAAETYMFHSYLEIMKLWSDSNELDASYGEYYSDNEDVVTVDSDGYVTAQGEGTATVYVQCGDYEKECVFICDFGIEGEENDVENENIRQDENDWEDNNNLLEIYEGEYVEIGPEDYIFTYSDSEYLLPRDVEGLTKFGCRLARNEIYARHGRLFNDSELQAYFDSKEWYDGYISPDEFDDSILNDYEIQNRNLLVEYANEMGY